jgi:hypothetical protein
MNHLPTDPAIRAVTLAQQAVPRATTGFAAAG